VHLSCRKCYRSRDDRDSASVLRYVPHAHGSSIRLPDLS
jgi:hypothetical protein